MTSLSRLYNEMLDSLATMQADMLRRMAAAMKEADADERARRAIEGAREWRDLDNAREWP